MIRDRRLVALLISSLLVYAVMQYVGIGVIPLRSIIEGGGGGGGDLLVNDPMLKADVAMAVEGSSVYIAWYDSAREAVMLRASDDGGSSFRDPILVSSTEGVGDVRVRGIVARGSYVNVLWSGEVDGQYDIFLSNSNDGAYTFSTMNLSSNDGDSGYPVMDASGPMVYVAWVDLTYGNSEVVLRVSTDGGSTFSDPVNVSNSPGESEAPVLVAEGSSVYMAWHDNSHGKFAVIFRASHDNGSTFSSPFVLSSVGADAGFASMDADGSSVYIVWMGNDSSSSDADSTTTTDDGYNIYMRYSNDGGRSFTDAMGIGKGRAPIVKADGPLACMVWIGDDALYASSMHGEYIRDAMRVAMYEHTSVRSVILDVEGNDVSILILSDGAGGTRGSSVVYVGSRDSGLTFSMSSKVTDGGAVDDVSMLSKGRGVYIAWSEKVCTNPECTHVRLSYHFGKSNDGGHQFIMKGI
ncbi:MAG: glycoside hydrolase [Candidatus Nitrosocaldus sp.]|nr:glycoside hydrolase [Candidatus Nitrosocaldus sp.]